MIEDDDDEFDEFDEWEYDDYSCKSTAFSTSRNHKAPHQHKSDTDRYTDDYAAGHRAGRRAAVEGDQFDYITGVKGSDAYKNGYNRGFEQNREDFDE